MHLVFPGPVGELEGELWEPQDGREPAVVCAFCHPHPLFGGNLKSKVVFRAARGVHKAGAAVLRFNFRGVGKSSGTHDGQGAEEDDLQAALVELQRRYPGAELWAGGFSFGARTAAQLAMREERIRRLLLVALPVLRFDCSPLDALRTPGLLVLAGDDIYGRPADLDRLLPGLSSRMDQVRFAGADHFFENRTQELELAIHAYAAGALPPTS